MDACRQWEVVYWLRDQQPPCPWHVDEEKWAYAARTGNLELLAWLQTQGCSFSSAATSAALSAHQFAAFRWLLAQEPACPLDKRIWTQGGCAPICMSSSDSVPMAQSAADLFVWLACSGCFSENLDEAPGHGGQLLLTVGACFRSY